MVMMIRVKVLSVGGGEVLAGRLAGEAARPFFEEAVGRESRNATTVLDFEGVHLVTASYFLGAFEWLWTSGEAHDRDLFPVLANMSRDTQDEVEIILKARGFRALFGTLSSHGLSDVVPFNLDGEATETYEQVARLGEATATELFRANPKIQPTGWSNRLALLYEHRLLRRRKQGRQLIYALSWR